MSLIGKSDSDLLVSILWALSLCYRVLFVCLLFVVYHIVHNYNYYNFPSCVILQLLHARQLFEHVHVHPTFTVHPALALPMNFWDGSCKGWFTHSFSGRVIKLKYHYLRTLMPNGYIQSNYWLALKAIADLEPQKIQELNKITAITYASIYYQKASCA